MLVQLMQTCTAHHTIINYISSSWQLKWTCTLELDLWMKFKKLDLLMIIRINYLRIFIYLFTSCYCTYMQENDTAFLTQVFCSKEPSALRQLNKAYHKSKIFEQIILSWRVAVADPRVGPSQTKDPIFFNFMPFWRIISEKLNLQLAYGWSWILPRFSGKIIPLKRRIPHMIDLLQV